MAEHVRLQHEPASLLQDRADYDEPSVFLPGAMLRETRRQRHLPNGNVPHVCLLDPDGDIVRQLVNSGSATRSESWSCYHTELWVAAAGGTPVGIVSCAVGASFAVLVAEQLFASGCEFLVSITSAGQVDPNLPQPCMVLIDRALRGEGTSHAYLPPSLAVGANPDLIAWTECSLRDAHISSIRGTSWTTDAPYRETETSLAMAKDQGAVVVEMEAAGLYAFSAARQRSVVCLAHVTNTMAVNEGDFEKGPGDGVEQALTVLAATIQGWQRFTAK